MMRPVTTITMSDAAGQLRLFSWLSPAFPIGGFAFSQGLETAIATDRVRCREDAHAWIAGQLHAGSMRTDAYFLAIAARAAVAGDTQALEEASALALALQASGERHAETRELAASFLEAARAWPIAVPDALCRVLDRPTAFPVAFGAMAGLSGTLVETAVLGYVNAAVAQQISVAVRLVPIGQRQGLVIQAALEPEIAAVAQAACHATITDIGTIAHGTDIASMRHETLKVRIFRS